MPQVPYTPYPTAQPSSGALPSVRISAPGAAFGTEVAQSVERLGGQIARAGDELFQRALALQQVQNKAEADQADAQFMEEAGILHEKFSTLQGQSAVAGLQPHIGALRAARERHREGLGSDDARRLYDSATRGFLARNIFNSAGHSARENRKWIAGASEARIQALKDYTYAQPEDNDSFNQGLKSIETEIRGTQAPIAGWGPEQTDQAVKKAQSGLISLRIAGLAQTNPEAAKGLLDQNRGRLVAEDAERTRQVVITQSRTIGSRIIADEVGSRDRDEPIDKVVAEGKKRWEKLYPNDPAGSDYVEQRIRSNRAKLQQDKRERDYDNREIINKPLLGGINGKLPTTVEELFAANPKAQQAWENLDETHRGPIRKQLVQNSKPDRALTDVDVARIQYLKGLAEDDPIAFQGVNILSENLPPSYKNGLADLQRKKRVNAERSPQLIHAMRILEPDLAPLGITRGEDKDRYIQFQGALLDALAFEQTQSGKRPDDKKVQEIGRRLLVETASKVQKFFFGPTFRFEDKPPDEVAEKARQDVFERTGVEPKPEQIQREYVRQIYEKMWGTPLP